ncbi:MAG: histidine kinase, partial [Bacteroidetes bacterium]
ITSVPDFIASRYGRSRLLSIVASLLTVVAVIPYISIQIRAITESVFLLATGQRAGIGTQPSLIEDPTFLVTSILALFAVLFGTRHLDPNERHEGLVAVIAFESVFKLIAFLAVGGFVTFFLYAGPSDLFTQAAAQPELGRLLDLSQLGINGWEWFWLSFVPILAFFLLPRQFHVSVVENNDPDHLRTAAWVLPLYLLLINLFVLPIALAGLIHFGDQGLGADAYVLSLPLAYGKEGLAILVALGGFAAASGMVIVATIALSITLSNNLFLPLVVQAEVFPTSPRELPARLLGIRRLSIAIVLLLAFAYYRIIGGNYSLVSIGLISFLGVAQFAPAFVGGLYWKLGTKQGALAGLLIGALVWLFTLPLPTLVEAGLLAGDFMEEGLLGLRFLRPYYLFGTQGMSQFSHAAFWSLSLNTLGYIVVSLSSKVNVEEVSQAEIFTNIEAYQDIRMPYDLLRREVSLERLQRICIRFLGYEQQQRIWTQMQSMLHSPERPDLASSALLGVVENQLSSALGSASAKIIISNISKTKPVSMEEMLSVLEETREILRYSKALEKQREELEKSTIELRQANAKLKELDRLKAEFITTVTHELRTPITSIKAFSKILQDNPDLPVEKQRTFTGILVAESERISRLINQVLDLEKLQEQEGFATTTLDFGEIVQQVVTNLSQLAKEKNINVQLDLPSQKCPVQANADLLIQGVTNILVNAIKFTPADGSGQIRVSLAVELEQASCSLEIQDNGPGIPEHLQQHIFDRFTQLTNSYGNKPQGSGLGLNITEYIVQQHGGAIRLLHNGRPGACFQITLPLDLSNTPYVV